MKPRQPIRRQNPRRAPARRRANRIAAMILEERGPRCQACRQIRRLEAHEIARGCDRAGARGARFATLALCSECHRAMDHASEWPRERQLALLQARCPHDYDLAAFCRVTAPRLYHQADVDVFLSQFQEQPNA